MNRLILILLFFVWTSFSIEKLSFEEEVSQIGIIQEIALELENLELDIKRSKNSLQEQNEYIQNYIFKLRRYYNFIDKDKAISKLKELNNLLKINNEKIFKKQLSLFKKPIHYSRLNRLLKETYDNKLIDIKQYNSLKKKLDLLNDELIKKDRLDANIYEKNISKNDIKYLINKAKLLFLAKDYLGSKKVLMRVLSLDTGNRVAVKLLEQISFRTKEVAKNKRDLSISELRSSINWSFSDHFREVPSAVVGKSLVRKTKVITSKYNNQIDEVYVKSPIVIRQLDLLAVLRKLVEEIKSQRLDANIFFEDDLKSNVDLSKKMSTFIKKGSSLKSVFDQISKFFTVNYKYSNNLVVISHKDIDLGGDKLSLVNINVTDELIEDLPKNENDEPDLKNFFEQIGVNFPEKSFITYIPTIKKILIKNTPQEIEKIHEFITNSKASFTQCDILSKIVEFKENNARDFSFNVNKHRASADVPASDSQYYDRIKYITAFNPNVFNGDVGDIPSGLVNNSSLRHSVSGNIVEGLDDSHFLAISHSINNYAIEATLRAVERSDKINIIATPRTTVKNGATAIIKIVEERYILEEIEPSLTQQAIDNNGDGISMTYPTHPIYGEPKEIGIVFEATPEINSDNYTISLTINPKITEYLGQEDLLEGVFINTEYDPSARTEILLPIIEERSLKSSVVLWDGETVSLGGVSRELDIYIDDKTPILHRIPIIGYLFKSRAKVRETVQLLFFMKINLNLLQKNHGEVPLY